MDFILQVENLKKYYGKFEALKGVNFEVKKGEVFALIGPNGAGKSTTLRIIATLLSVSEGRVLFMGKDLSKYPDFVRENISYLPEEAGAYKNMKGIDYLRFMANFYAVDPKDVDIFVKRAEEISELGDRLNDKIGIYSKGMVRKLLIARALMTKPILAILDEPTSGLDVINALEIRELVREYVKEGTSVLLSSHNMLEIEFLSDRVALIDKGKILEIGTSEELKDKYSAKNLEEVFRRVVQ
ncbi:MAG TPA: ABC transporter ATP-binding protein [Dictyoglomaceae bacterium]|nr:ABC transporter ATP-binding protein [Dictyoglomaceae bacterium]HOL39496.1 ABC transporter ATP-binding protein [Dictyoglomaceae bacterium]HPP15363.1 ABC transporter ATP-binding protein [Dictyoglomaceae bacterium]HPU44025.1 ABC transporter ATP-binding protein [Dictyoglomaceae bacterium]